LMYTLIKILQGTLGDNDPRWLAFGLLMPSMNATPGKPTGLSAHLDENGKVILQNDPLPLATRYRYRGFVVDLETDYRLLASSKEPMASITDAAPGQTLQIIVQAVNGNLQGVPSDPILFTLPPAAKAVKPEAGDQKSEIASSRKAGEATRAENHGTGNGHANGHRRHPRT
jgi:hypothetical protein